jgi:RNA polymerase sigma factor (sigma-70 family)
MNGEHGEEDLSLAEQAATENARLVLAIGSGDRDAERDFAVRYLPRVRAMLLARSRDLDLSTDLLQDVMIESICALRRGQLREPAKLTAFVLAIARNVLNSHYRTAARQPERLEFPDDIPDMDSLVDKVEEQQRRSLAMNVIAGMNPTDRAILHLTLVEGLKPGIIAEKLGLSPDVVRQRKLRATRRVVEFVAGLSRNDSGTHILTGRTP